MTLIVSANERSRRAEVDGLFRARETNALIDRLTDPSWAVRRAVVSALARLGDDAVGPLCEVLKHHRDDEGRIAAALDALVGSLGQVEPAAIALVEASDAAIVSDGAQILGRRRCAAALPHLAQLAKGPDDNVAMAAIEAIGRIGGEGAIDLLIAAIQSGSFFRAFPAIDVLGRTGDPRAVAPLVALLGDPRYAIEAARALGSSGQPLALPPLTALLVRPDDAQVRVAAAALTEISDLYTERFGPNHVVGEGLAAIDAAQANRQLSHALLDANPSERTSLCRVLGLLGIAGAVPSLVELLDAEPEAAQAAASALSSLPRDAEPYLLSALRNSSSERRLLLLPILGRRPSAKQEVLSCLTDDNSGVRAVACDALGKLGDTDAVIDLFGLLRDGDARVSQAAVAAIQALGGNETERLALVAAASTDARERRSGLRILSYFGWPSALDTFLAAMDDADERIRDLAAIGLASIDDERSRGALVIAARHA
jgi:HEAT repeat protein